MTSMRKKFEKNRTDSLDFTPESETTLLINYTPI